MTTRPTLALAVCLALLLGGAGAGAAEDGRRIVAIGDIHGAFNGVRSILRETGLVDERDRWTGGDAILVQTGDFLDRGPGATKVAELLMDLQAQAPAAGGEVVVLLGNHEVLNLVGDLRDVTKYILRNLVDKSSERRLKISCNAYADFYHRLAEHRGDKPLPKRRELLDRCFAEQQPGLVEYLREIGPEGRIGRWIRTLPAAVKIGGVVFVHGGLNAQFAGWDLERINEEVRREIDDLDRAREVLLERRQILPTSSLAQVVALARQVVAAAADGVEFPHLESFERLTGAANWLTLREDGPLWFRGYGRWSDEEGRERMPAILEALGAERVVVAHTPQKTGSILPRFDARVFLIDTGMLVSVYKGRPSALEIEDGRFTAVYVMDRTVLHGP